ncbi:hypothetical protein EDB87DRAFT_1627911 [Lactarius vividus]|nr:hypothetical protein EDB87DRAFT_1627911 [Lactarius vividus]
MTPPVADLPPKDDAEGEPQSLFATLAELLSLAFLQRLGVGLAPRKWLWEDPRAVCEFLEACRLGVLVHQLNQPSEIVVVVPGLCAFFLSLLPRMATNWC